jgi:spore coat polysaccharide biosynthesis protein SpsF
MNNIALATILTVRMNSDRLPGKVVAEIEGVPMMGWIIERLKKLPGKIIVATSELREDDEIEKVGQEAGVSVYRGDLNDVVGRMDKAVKTFYPEAKYVLRALGDCPFIESALIERSLNVMERQQSDAFMWQLSPDTWPVYGSREFPFSRKAWDFICENSSGCEREHTDQFFHRNRQSFHITYHEPPSTVYFRPYRLEVDWPEDLELVRSIAKLMDIASSPEKDIIRLLDERPDLASINQQRVEITGPITSYDYSLRRTWMKCMTGKPVILWDDTIWKPIDNKAVPIFCNSGRCLVGYGYDGILYTREGDRISSGYRTCSCGAGKYWKESLARSK